MIQKIIVTIVVIAIYAIIYWKEIKLIKNKKVKDTLQILLGILFVPAFILLLDIWNYFEVLMPNVYNSITEKYDMLSFLGAYLSAIVSSVLLIIITDKDRKENTEIIQDAQRPYLDVRFSYTQTKYLDELQENDDKVTVLYHGSSRENDERKSKERLVCVEIQNKGNSVAILDVNSIKIKINYYAKEKDCNGAIITSLKEEEKSLNSIITRMAVGTNEKVYIAFTYDYLYENGKIKNGSIITNSYIVYKDLFNKKYVDESGMNEEGNQYAIKDNKIIEEE